MWTVVIIVIDTDVTVPTPRTPAQITTGIKEKIENGEYILGDLIVPKTYSVPAIDNDGEFLIYIQTHNTSIHGNAH